MAQSLVTEQGVLVIPGAYSTLQVQQAPNGLATTGVLMLVGEADAGPDYTAESVLNDNTFGPDQAADVIAKYKSGNLVGAFKSACAASNDPNIQGSFSTCILVKTNPSAKATGSLLNFGSTQWSAIQDRGYGKMGNLIYTTVTTEQAEALPTTGPLVFLPPINSTNISFRVNGGAALPLTLSAAELPSAIQSAIDGLAGVAATGGANRTLLTVSGTLALTVVSGNSVTISRSIAWTNAPSIGDTLFIETASVLASVHATNAGGYVVTAVTAASVTATKLLNAAGSPTVVAAPINQTALSIADVADLQAFSPITITLEAGNPSDGLGKTLEIAQLTSGTDLLSYLVYSYSTSGGAVASTWVSTVASPKTIDAAAEYIPNLVSARQVDNLTETLSAGGVVALKLGYLGTSGSAVITPTTMTITVVGGAGTSPPVITLADYPTISDLATYINSLTGFTAAPGTAVVGSQPSTSLDDGTFTIGSTFGAYTGRIKNDAYRFYNEINQNSILVQFPSQPASGLPEPQAIQYLAGGTKGYTTDAIFNAAVDALENCRGNFLVPLMSRDASADIADALTDPSSTYTIANIHSYCRSHVLKMSTFKRKRNRLAVLSIRSNFVTDKNTSSNIASARCAMTYQDVKDVGANGIVQFQPWMAAVKAASMQAAGFYRPIVRKVINISGALQAAGDFNDQNDSNMEAALEAGLLPIRQSETGGFFWVSDQTTYGKDNNFVYNSLQAMYVADVIALTASQRMEQAFVGQSIADVNASMALTTLESIMEDFRRLKLISPSDDAPKGFKNAAIKIVGPAMYVNVEVKLAGALYFIVLNFLVSQVTQAA